MGFTIIGRTERTGGVKSMLGCTNGTLEDALELCKDIARTFDCGGDYGILRRDGDDKPIAIASIAPFKGQHVKSVTRLDVESKDGGPLILNVN